MSALPPKADMCGAKRDVRFVPIVGHSRLIRITSSAATINPGGIVSPICLGSFDIDYHFESGRCLHRKLGRFVATQNAVDIGCTQPIVFILINPIGRKASGLNKELKGIHCRKAVLGHESSLGSHVAWLPRSWCRARGSLRDEEPAPLSRHLP